MSTISANKQHTLLKGRWQIQLKSVEKYYTVPTMIVDDICEFLCWNSKNSILFTGTASNATTPFT